MSILKKIFGDANEKYLKSIRPLVERINNLEPEFEGLSDFQLKEKTKEFKERLNKGETLDDLLPEAFALVREAAKRTLNERHFDVQLTGGIVLHEAKIAQMANGEGKTLTATLPLYLNALEGKGVHLVTVNDYLARRDTVWMGQIYHLLGMKVGCINHRQAFLYDPDYKKADLEKDEIRDELGSFRVVEDFLKPISKREAYLADITYGTNNEFGFDYLRDNLVYDTGHVAQRSFHYAIIDEVDSILIDEARTPLIISEPAEAPADLYYRLARIVDFLKEKEDYIVDEKMKTITLTEKGQDEMVDSLGLDPWALSGSLDLRKRQQGSELQYHIDAALRAKRFFERDRDYVVRDDKVIIVDEFTGRLMPGRRWSGGLHQAVEAKERAIFNQREVKVQRESRTLGTISFQNLFRLYERLAGMTGTALTSAEEFQKVYNLEVIDIPTNLPVIRKDLSDKVFKSKKGRFKALIREIKKSYQIGQPVLVGTRSIEKNENLSDLLEKEGIPHQVLNAKNHKKEAQIIAQAGKLETITVATNMAGRGVNIILGGNPKDPEEEKKVRDLGGLRVLGTERHESRRIDNQLRGRAGRQGASGNSQFLLSLEDDLLRIFGGSRIQGLMERLKIPEDEPIEAKLISGAIRKAQAQIEGFHFDARKHLLEYDNVVNKHRQTFYRKRQEILEASKKDLREKIFKILEKENCDIKTYEEKEEKIGFEKMREIEKFFFLRTLDFFWQEHLEIMESLRGAVRLRAYGKLDPLVEYKSEGYKLFKELFEKVEKTLAKNLLRIRFSQP